MATLGRNDHKMDVGEEGIVCSWPGGRTYTIPWNQCLMSTGKQPMNLNDLTQDQRYHIASDMIKDGSNSKLFRYLFKRAWPSPNPADYTGSLNKDFLDMSKNNSLEVHADNLTTIEWNASRPARTVPIHIVGVTRDCGISSSTIAPWADSITSFATAFDTATKSAGKVWPPQGETIILTEGLFKAFGYPAGMYLKATTLSNVVWTFELIMFGRTFKGRTDNENIDFVELKNFTQGNDKNKQWFKQNPFKVTGGRIDRQPGDFVSLGKASKIFNDYTPYETTALLIIILKSLGDRLQCLFHLLNWVEHKQGPQTTVLMNTCDGPVFTVSLQFGPNTALLYDKYTNKGDKNRYHRCLLLDRVVNPCDTCRKKNIIKISDCIDSNSSLIRLYTTIYHDIKNYYGTVSSENYIFRLETNDTLPQVTERFFLVILRQLTVCNYKLIRFRSFLKSVKVIAPTIFADNQKNILTPVERTKIHTTYNEMLNTSTNEFIKDYGYISFFTDTNIVQGELKKLRISNNNKLTMGGTRNTLMIELNNELSIASSKGVVQRNDYITKTISKMMMEYLIIIPFDISKKDVVRHLSTQLQGRGQRARRTAGELTQQATSLSQYKGGTGRLYSSIYQTGGTKFLDTYINNFNFMDFTDVTTSLRNIIPLKDILLETIQNKYNIHDDIINKINAVETGESNVTSDNYTSRMQQFMNIYMEQVDDMQKKMKKEASVAEASVAEASVAESVAEAEADAEASVAAAVAVAVAEAAAEASVAAEAAASVADAEASVAAEAAEAEATVAAPDAAAAEAEAAEATVAAPDAAAAEAEAEAAAEAMANEAFLEAESSEAADALAADALAASEAYNVINNLLPHDIKPDDIVRITSVYNDIYTKLYSRLNICIRFNLKKILITNLYNYIVWYRRIDPSSISNISHPIFDLITDLTSITEKLSSIGIVPPIYNEISLISEIGEVSAYQNNLINTCQYSSSYGFIKEENNFRKYMKTHVIPIVDTSIILIPLNSQDMVDGVVQQIITKMELEKNGEPTGGAEEAEDSSGDEKLSSDIYTRNAEDGTSQEITHKDIENKVYDVIKSKEGEVSDTEMDQIVTNIKNDLDMTYSVRRALSFPDLSTGGRSDIHNKYTKRGKMYKRKKYTKRGKMYKRKYTKRGKMHKRKYTKR